MARRGLTSTQAPLFVEIVGVAGTGKSTLARLLCEREGWSLVDGLHTRKPAHWGLAARGVPRVMRLTAASIACPPRISWDEAEDVLYIESWQHYLERAHREGIAVLDQGPLFALARLCWSGKPVTRRNAFQRWLVETARSWATRLDLVVWLDAPDEELVSRIDARAQPHAVKRMGNDAFRVLDAHGRAYDRVLGLASHTRARILRLETASTAPLQLAEAVVGAVTELRKTTSPAPSSDRSTNLVTT